MSEQRPSKKLVAVDGELKPSDIDAPRLVLIRKLNSRGDPVGDFAYVAYWATDGNPAEQDRHAELIADAVNGWQLLHDEVTRLNREIEIAKSDLVVMTEIKDTVNDTLRQVVTERNELREKLRATPEPFDDPFQDRVHKWMQATFDAETVANKRERNHRFLEESLELVQSLGCTQTEAHMLVDYVFGRPVGECEQETGGVMVTLAALANANSIRVNRAAETELARCWTKIEQIRAKQAGKPKHSPLPGPSEPPGALLADEVIAWQCGCGWINLDRESPFCAGCDSRRPSPTKSERTDKCFADCGDNCQCEKYPPQYCKGCSNTVDQCICTAGETKDVR